MAMRILKLKTVDAYLAFDLECPTSAGGTRLAPDVTERETQLLARAMTYKFAVLGVKIGGAKATIRATDAERDDAVRRYVEEIRRWSRAARFSHPPTWARSPRTSARFRAASRRASCTPRMRACRSTRS